jgi:gas vesicle protein
MLVTHTNAQDSYTLSRLLAAYVNHIVQINTCGPIRLDDGRGSNQPTWAAGIIRACKTSKALKSVLIKGAVRAWVALGAEKMSRLQMSAHPVDAKWLSTPEFLRDNVHALKTATANGLSAMTYEIEAAFGDWTDDIRETPMNITCIHGRENALYSIECVRALCAESPNKMKLIEIEGAGFTGVYSHSETVVQFLRSIVDDHVRDGQRSELVRNSAFAATLHADTARSQAGPLA